MKYSRLTFTGVDLLAGQVVGGSTTFTELGSTLTVMFAGAPWITLPWW